MSGTGDLPFLTDDFSPKGGGIDFLGLRWVNLTIVGRDLIPELNNVTSDMGTFFLGAWIPWKFRQLCSNQRDYTPKKYNAFREKAEVALSLTLQDKEGVRPWGAVRNRIGSTQHSPLPGQLNFVTAGRTPNNSLYAAAIYGPALRALGLIAAYHSQTQEGRESLPIPLPGDDEDSEKIVRGVDDSLRHESAYSHLASLESPDFDWKDIRGLAEAGLDPARYRAPEHNDLKASFRRKLLPANAEALGYARTLTCRLLVATLAQRAGLSTGAIRRAWYTGMFGDREPLRLYAGLIDHRLRWAAFLARQHQRYAIELFLWCFETALAEGAQSVEDVVVYWSKRADRAGREIKGTFEDILDATAGRTRREDDLSTSQAWNGEVHGDDDRFEVIDDPQNDEAALHGLSMFAGWYWRMLARQQDGRTTELMHLGGSDRMSIAWFLRWLQERRGIPIVELLTDIFSDLVFAQHMRIALARFDGTAQRLRFLLGDSGIEPTLSARADLGQRGLPSMPDRLDTLIGLLCDCDVLTMTGGSVDLGPAAGEFIRS
jgi:hypothetical protein